jgi:hypothetical protein
MKRRGLESCGKDIEKKIISWGINAGEAKPMAGQIIDIVDFYMETGKLGGPDG